MDILEWATPWSIPVRLLLEEHGDVREPTRPSSSQAQSNDERRVRRLEQCAIEAGLATRSHRKQEHFTIINRIVVEELESWYFGDWQAVHADKPRVSPTTSLKARDPDNIAGGTWEAFQRVLQKAGYFETGLRKIEAARAIAPHLDPARNRSHSFQVLYQAILELAGSG